MRVKRRVITIVLVQKKRIERKVQVQSIRVVNKKAN